MQGYVCDRKTTDAQVRKARAIARRLNERTDLHCNVDDWGRFGNFQIVVDLGGARNDRGYYDIEADLRSLTRAIKKAVGESGSASLDQWEGGIEHPSPEYRRCRTTGESEKLGYDRHYSMFHIKVSE